MRLVLMKKNSNEARQLCQFSWQVGLIRFNAHGKVKPFLMHTCIRFI